MKGRRQPGANRVKSSSEVLQRKWEVSLVVLDERLVLNILIFLAELNEEAGLEGKVNIQVGENLQGRVAERS